MRVFDEWLLTPFRLAVHEPTATAVIADVHLGYREARQQTGDAVPLLDVSTQLSPLRQARARYVFDKLVVAGDLFERGVDRSLLDRFLNALGELRVRFAGLVPGNHDRGWEALQPTVPLFPAGMRLGSWRVVHYESSAADVPTAIQQTSALQSSKIVGGHWHPAVRYRGRRVPCYLVGPKHIILPAFSADAAGDVVAAPAGGNWRRFAISAARVIACGAAPKNENPRRRLRGFRRATGSAGSATRYQ